MFFPLGLGGPPSRLPIATLFIFILSCAVSGYYLSSLQDLHMNEVSSEYRNLQRELKVIKSKIIYKYCVDQYSEGQCEAAKEHRRFTTASSSKKIDILEERFEELKKPIEIDEDGDDDPYFTHQWAYWNSRLRLGENEKNWPESVKDEEEFFNYKKTRYEGLKKIRDAYSELGVLSIENISLKSLILSTLIHGSLLHLIGNMIIFLAIGFYVEQQLGSSLYFMTTLLGSFFGLFLQVNMVPDYSVLGFSAGVYVVLGLFYVLFFKNYLKLFCFYFVGGKTFYLPVAWSIPVLYVAHDLLMLGSPSQPSVGHWAHAGGFLFGCLVGFIKRKKDNFKHDCIYPEEVRSYSMLEKSQDFENVFSNYKKCLSLNWQNRRASLLFFIKFQSLNMGPTVSISKKDNAQLSDRLTDLIGIIYMEKNDEELSYWIELIPPFLDNNQLYRHISIQRVVRVADILATKGILSRAKWFYEYALNRKPTQKMAANINRSLKQLEFYEEKKEAV